MVVGSWYGPPCCSYGWERHPCSSMIWCCDGTCCYMIKCCSLRNRERAFMASDDVGNKDKGAKRRDWLYILWRGSFFLFVMLVPGWIMPSEVFCSKIPHLSFTNNNLPVDQALAQTKNTPTHPCNPLYYYQQGGKEEVIPSHSFTCLRMPAINFGQLPNLKPVPPGFFSVYPSKPRHLFAFHTEALTVHIMLSTRFPLYFA